MTHNLFPVTPNKWSAVPREQAGEQTSNFVVGPEALGELAGRRNTVYAPDLGRLFPADESQVSESGVTKAKVFASVGAFNAWLAGDRSGGVIVVETPHSERAEEVGEFLNVADRVIASFFKACFLLRQGGRWFVRKFRSGWIEECALACQHLQRISGERPRRLMQQWSESVDGKTLRDSRPAILRAIFLSDWPRASAEATKSVSC